MDKNTFDKEVYNSLPVFDMPAYFEAWQVIRQQSLAQLTPNVRSIDYHLIEAVHNSMKGLMTAVPEADRMVPGFKNRLTQYKQLQAAILHDLTKINKELNKASLPFRDWL